MSNRRSTSILDPRFHPGPLTSALAERVIADYDTDFYAWTQEQAVRLRALRGDARFLMEIDIDDIAEEIESLGRSDFSAVESQLTNVFSHPIKAISAPASLANSHRRTEGVVFARDMQRRYSRSMGSEIDIRYAWTTSREAAQVSLEAQGQTLLVGLPAKCPLSVAELFETGLRFTGFEAMMGERLTDGS